MKAWKRRQRSITTRASNKFPFFCRKITAQTQLSPCLFLPNCSRFENHRGRQTVLVPTTTTPVPAPARQLVRPVAKRPAVLPRRQHRRRRRHRCRCRCRRKRKRPHTAPHQLDRCTKAACTTFCLQRIIWRHSVLGGRRPGRRRGRRPPLQPPRLSYLQRKEKRKYVPKRNPCVIAATTNQPTNQLYFAAALFFSLELTCTHICSYHLKSETDRGLDCG